MFSLKKKKNFIVVLKPNAHLMQAGGGLVSERLLQVLTAWDWQDNSGWSRLKISSCFNLINEFIHFF